MHVLVATDGKLDITTTSAFAMNLAGATGRVTVLTVVEVPRMFLQDMRIRWGAANGFGVIIDDQYVETPAVPQQAPRGWPGDDAIIARYLDDKLELYAAPLVGALVDAGVTAEGRVVESENVARTILEQIGSLDADVVVIGSHGQGLFQGLLGSTGTKVVRRSSKPVLLIHTTPIG
ncbi:MAG TPA: universal stress protein [Acidimicrobiia bacterium]|nr:universal stress protein [Acidimicrobiia bacterium]